MSGKTPNPLRNKIDAFPNKPGIYFFKDASQNVIYIGKARSLKDRVRSYFAASSETKVNNILAETSDIEYILTGSEKEAIFLENNFIQQYQPKFNLRLKDDKSYPYLKLTLQDRFPSVCLTRRVEADGSKYFGPFSPAHQAREAIHLLSRYFGIRTCSEKVPGKRKRPCLEYDLDLCSAPCTGHIQESEYMENLRNARLFLEGNVEKLLNITRKKMKEAAARQEFEQAARWRDLLQTLENIKEKPKLTSVGLEDKDIIGFSRNNERSALYVFLMRKGKVIESESSIDREDPETPADEIFSRFLHDVYRDKKDWPDKILLPFSPTDKKQLQQDITLRAGRRIQILVPRKGKNKKLVELANKNADMILRETPDQLSLLRETQKLLGLDRIPRRIEGFDISHTGGEESVGAVVVFEDGRPRKQEYRKYRIRTVEGPDDVASLQEIIHRRYARIMREKAPLPDLVFVDGGKGQLNTAKKTLARLGLFDLAVVSLAKREEILFTPAAMHGLKLDRTSPPLKLLQHVRDEAHRFAISYHRLKRKKRSFASALDGIPGLGPQKKRKILTNYDSITEVKASSAEELAKLVGKKVAAAILEKLG